MKVSGTIIADGNAINVNIGFIPDYIEAFELTSDPEIVYRWFRCLAERDGATAATFMYGIEDDGAGAIEYCADADDGFIAYDATDQAGSVLIENPSTHRLEPQAVLDWLAATNYSTGGTDRSATVVGTIIRPPTHNGYVYELKTGVGAASSEPTAGWGTTPGETSTDGGSNVWICRVENIAKNGGIGFTIGSNQSVDSDVWVFKAERHDRVGDMGDADGADPLSFN